MDNVEYKKKEENKEKIMKNLTRKSNHAAIREKKSRISPSPTVEFAPATPDSIRCLGLQSFDRQHFSCTCRHLCWRLAELNLLGKTVDYSRIWSVIIDFRFNSGLAGLSKLFHELGSSVGTDFYQTGFSSRQFQQV